MQDAYNRFDLMFDDAEEHIEQKEKELEKRKKAADKERRRIEEKGECEGCGDKKYNRWVDNEFYLCYDCYYEGMQQAGDLYSYYSIPAEDVPGFIDSCDWEYLWENNE